MGNWEEYQKCLIDIDKPSAIRIWNCEPLVVLSSETKKEGVGEI